MVMMLVVSVGRLIKLVVLKRCVIEVSVMLLL